MGSLLIGDEFITYVVVIILCFQCHIVENQTSDNELKVQHFKKYSHMYDVANALPNMLVS